MVNTSLSASVNRDDCDSRPVMGQEQLEGLEASDIYYGAVDSCTGAPLVMDDLYRGD